MPTIPLYQHQRQIASPSMPRASSSLFGNLGAQSEQLQNTLQKLEDTRDHRALTESQLLLQEHDARFEENALNTPYKTPAERMEAYDKSLRAFADTQLQNAPSSRARDALSNQLRAHAAQSKITQAKAAADAELKKSHTITQAAIDLAIKDGDLDLALRHYDEGIALGLYYAETRENFIHQTQTRIQHNQVMRMVNTDPLLAKEQLEERDADGNPTHFTHLDEAARYTLINHAERNFSQLAQTTFEDLATRIDDGETLGSKELDALVARRLLTDKQARAILKMQSTGKFDTAAYAELHNTILAYDPALDANNKRHAELLGHILAMPPSHATELRKLLGEKLGGFGVGSSAAKNIFAEITARFKLGLYGNYDEYYTEETYDAEGNVESQKERKRVNGERYEQALNNRLRVEAEARRFIQQNPRATEEEINAHIQAYQSEIMSSAIRDQLGSAIADAAKAAGVVPSSTDTAPPSLHLWKPNLLTNAIGSRAGVY